LGMGYRLRRNPCAAMDDWMPLADLGEVVATKAVRAAHGIRRAAFLASQSMLWAGVNSTSITPFCLLRSE
jgi:hypothetical protein